MGTLRLENLPKDTPDFELEVDGHTVKCWEMTKRPYRNGSFSAGLAQGAEPDTVHFRLQRDGGEDPLTVLLRPDEMQAPVWVITGAPWSHAMLQDGED